MDKPHNDKRFAKALPQIMPAVERNPKPTPPENERVSDGFGPLVSTMLIVLGSAGWALVFCAYAALIYVRATS